MSLAAFSRDFVIDQGSTWTLELELSDSNGPINLTGYTARMMWKSDYGVSTPALSVTSSNAITLGGALGTIKIRVSDVQTAAIQASSYVYDLELISAPDSNGLYEVTKFMRGKIQLRPEVTA